MLNCKFRSCEFKFQPQRRMCTIQQPTIQYNTTVILYSPPYKVQKCINMCDIVCTQLVLKHPLASSIIKISTFIAYCLVEDLKTMERIGNLSLMPMRSKIKSLAFHTLTISWLSSLSIRTYHLNLALFLYLHHHHCLSQDN